MNQNAFMKLHKINKTEQQKYQNCRLSAVWWSTNQFTALLFKPKHLNTKNTCISIEIRQILTFPLQLCAEQCLAATEHDHHSSNEFLWNDQSIHSLGPTTISGVQPWAHARLFDTCNASPVRVTEPSFQCKQCFISSSKLVTNCQELNYPSIYLTLVKIAKANRK